MTSHYKWLHLKLKLSLNSPEYVTIQAEGLDYIRYLTGPRTVLVLNSHLGGIKMWLSLTEYSLKHHVSISTLRRKIKADDIQYKLDDGKYYLFDESTQLPHRPSLSSENSSERSEALDNSNSNIQRSNTAVKTEIMQKPEGESVITAANRLLADLKKAYTQVLHEKEEQIIYLKEEISDLKTLVKILESHNQRNESRQLAQDARQENPRNYSSDVYQIDSDI